MMITSAVQSASMNSGLSNQQLTSEDFLELLSAQLRYQDPLEPMSGEAMLTQIAQLTTVSELTALNDNFMAMSDAHNVTDVATLLGKRVEWSDPESGELRSGVVTEAQLGEAGWEVCVGSEVAAVTDIISVR